MASTLHRPPPFTRPPRALSALVIASSLGTLLVACERRTAPGDPVPNPRVIGALGDSAGLFVYPRCLALGPDGLWVIDRSARVQRFDPDTGRCTGLFKTPEYDVGKPTGLFIGPGPGADGTWVNALLFIADTHYNRVLVYHPAPVDPHLPSDRTPKLSPPLVKSFGTFGRGPGQFIYPTDIAVEYAPDRTAIARIFISEYGGNDRVSIFDASWNFISSFGSPGTSPDPDNIQFSRPQSLALIGPPDRRRLLVTDLTNHRLGVFTLEGRLDRWVGAEATPDLMTQRPALPDTINLPERPAAGPAALASVGQPARFLFPMGVCVLDDHTVLVTEFGAARVQRIDLVRAVSLGSWGRPGRGEGELASPWDAVVDGSTTYILDSGNNRLLAFQAPGVRRSRNRVGPAHGNWGASLRRRARAGRARARSNQKNLFAEFLRGFLPQLPLSTRSARAQTRTSVLWWRDRAMPVCLPTPERKRRSFTGGHRR